MHMLKLTQIGNSVGVVLPKEALARLKLGKGESIFLTETPDGYALTPYDPALEEEIKAGREFMRDFRDTFLNTPDRYLVMGEMQERSRRDPAVAAAMSPMRGYWHQQWRAILEAGRADVVLDTRQIAKWAGALGGRLTVIPIENAKHDVFLSEKDARERAYAELGAWLAREIEA